MDVQNLEGRKDVGRRVKQVKYETWEWEGSTGVGSS